jgi:hypothetical protein
MFNVAIDQNFLGVNPARGGIGMKAFKELPRERYLEMVEVESVLTAIQARIVKNSSDPAEDVRTQVMAVPSHGCRYGAAYRNEERGDSWA